MILLIAEEFDALVRLRSDEVPLLEGVPHLDAPDVRPLFPSWSLVCVGTSSLYRYSIYENEIDNKCVSLQSHFGYQRTIWIHWRYSLASTRCVSRGKTKFFYYLL